MDNLLIIIGAAIIALALWREWTKDSRLRAEVQDYKKLRDELITAKQEVHVLMEHLEAASEKIVEEISVGLEELKNQSTVGNKDTSEQKELAPASQAISEAQDEEVSEGYGTNPPERVVPQEEIVKPKNHSSEKKGIDKRSINNTIIFPSGKNSITNKVRSPKNEHMEKPVSPKHQMVYAMATMGYSEDEIARQMKIGKGEVRLMLQLKRKGEEGNG